jgi:hypothetical protein
VTGWDSRELQAGCWDAYTIAAVWTDEEVRCIAWLTGSRTPPASTGWEPGPRLADAGARHDSVAGFLPRAVRIVHACLSMPASRPS